MLVKLFSSSENQNVNVSVLEPRSNKAKCTGGTFWKFAFGPGGKNALLKRPVAHAQSFHTRGCHCTAREKTFNISVPMEKPCTVTL